MDSEKLAAAVDRSWAATGKTDKLKVFVQVNTSQEDSEFYPYLHSYSCMTLKRLYFILKDKSGLDTDHAVNLVRFMCDKCPRLQLIGLMTIGAYGYDTSSGPNPDFVKLAACRDRVCQALSLDLNDLELSMGMSTDFENAVSPDYVTFIWVKFSSRFLSA